MSKLVSYVHVIGEDGQPAIFAPEDTIPEWAAKQMGAHCFVGGVHPSDEQDSAGEPPRAGKGSGREAWVAFAEANGQSVAEEATREEIIADLESAGIVEEK